MFHGFTCAALMVSTRHPPPWLLRPPHMALAQPVGTMGVVAPAALATESEVIPSVSPEQRLPSALG